ncbi:MAG: PDZ domain-containing protein [Armatimonadetes bacterium]|nr:PDZ domain-containing protein [Armatimonadota bacterium]
MNNRFPRTLFPALPLSPLWSILFCVFCIAASIPAAAQPSRLDSLIRESLRVVDLPAFTWPGPPDPLRPRLGIYSNPVPADTAAVLAGFPAGARGFKIWHLMPHWPADESGIFIGDIILSMNGKPIGDSLHNGDEYMAITARDMRPGDTAWFRILRDGVVREFPIRLATATRTPMPFLEPQFNGRGVFPTTQASWLGQTLAEQGLTAWGDTIKKQMRVISDQDFCTVPFAGRPNPWRLNAITYLHNHPTRLAAYSRYLSEEAWSSFGANGVAGALWAAGHALDLPVGLPAELPTAAQPTNFDAVAAGFAAVQQQLDRAYSPVRPNLDSLTAQLMRILDIEHDWETLLDSIGDRTRRRNARNAQESRMAALFAEADKVDMAALFTAAQMLATLADTGWIRQIASTIPTPHSSPRADGVTGTVIHEWTTPQGRCVIGGPGPNRYSGTFLFIMDVGGDDVYQLPPATLGSFRLLVDVGGDDLYHSNTTGQGAGVGAVDMLVDLQGNDTYRAAMFSQGAGLLGIGVLADYAGDDVYTARWCSQGAGFLGAGIIWEGGGADQYSSEVFSQAFGYARGYGAILETEGNDSYRAGWKIPDSRYPGRAHLAMSQGFGYGMRPWTTGIGTDGGIGLLSDRRGSDLYASDFFSQGGSYWYALGILHDAEGYDRYTAGQYSQGSGIHLSFGALLDDAGDDMYDAYHGLEQGNAHDWSSGCLEDLAGNDTYRGSTSSQGSALNVAFAWLLDYNGNDHYYIKLSDTTHSQGGGNFNRPRKHGSLGLLLDIGHGDDYYVEPRVRPGTAVVKGNKGIVFDDGGK